MKRISRKNFIKICTATAVTTSLAACGATSSSEAGTTSTSTSTDTTSTSTDTASDLEELTVKIWLLGPGKQADSDKVWAEFNTKLKDVVPNTTVEFTVVSGDEYKDNFNRMLASGEAVDLAWVGYATDVNQDMSDGNLLPMDELVAQYGSNIVAACGEAAMDATRYLDGQLYFCYAWQGIVGSPTAIYMPKELADLGGADWVDNMQAVSNTACADPTLDNIQAFYDEFALVMPPIIDAGKLYGGIDYRNNMSFTFSYGGPTLGTLGAKNSLGIQNVNIFPGDDTFTVVDSIATDFAKLKYQNMADFYNKGYFRSDIASLKQTWLNPDGSWGADDQIVWAHNAYSATPAEDQKPVRGRDMVAIRKNDMYWIEKQTGGMAVPYSAENPERAMMVLDALYANAELYQLLIYGIEGEHYTDNGDGTVTTPYGSQGTAEDAYGLWKWVLGTCMNSFQTQADAPGYYDYQKEMEASAYIHPLINFIYDRSNTDAIILALTAIDNEYLPLMEPGVMGDKWEETYNQWIAERKAAGVDEFIADYQAQIDAFISENGITSWNYVYKPAHS